MTELSPDAQAVRDSFFARWEDEPLQHDLDCLAAALRTLVFEVVEPSCPPSDPLDVQDDRVRDELAQAIIGIAEELEDKANG